MSAIWKRRSLGLALAGLIFIVDQWIKSYVMHGLKLREVGVIDLLPFFDLRWTQNFGVSLGMLTAETPEMKYLLIAFTSLVALFVFGWLLRESNKADIAGLALILGGAIGNIRDRVNHGFVIDYADLHFGEFRPFLIFNLADAAITIGVLIILARALLSREKPESEAQGDSATES